MPRLDEIKATGGTSNSAKGYETELMRVFAASIEEGQIRKQNVELAAFLLSGKIDEDQLLPGLLVAAYRKQTFGKYWRKGVSTGFGGQKSDAMGVLEIARAKIYLAQRCKSPAKTLDDLTLPTASISMVQSRKRVI